MPNTSDLIFDTLERWGVDTIFGIPGDGINGLMEALRKKHEEGKIKFVLMRHEEAAAFAACAYAKFTGKLGVCIATTGPGGIHLLNGLYDAKMDNAPVLALTGHTYSDIAGTQYQQDVNFERLFNDVAEYVVEVNNPEHARVATDVACRTALARRGVSAIAVPIDVQEAEYKGKLTKHRMKDQTSEAPVQMPTVPPLASLERAASMINAASRPVILAGAGMKGARAELIQLAEHLQAPVVKALLGKDVMPDDHPLDMGGIGLLGTAPGEKAIEGTDLLLMIGTNFPYSDHLPNPEKVKAVQIDIEPTHIGLRFPVDVGLVGDSKETLQALMPLLQAKGASDWLAELQGHARNWWDLMESRASRDEDPLKPQVVAWELGKRLRDDAIICGDSGTNTTWVARYIKLRAEQRFSCSGMLATMAPAVPYAIAAQKAFPERQVVAFMGDGALMMLAGELSTVVQHELPIKIVVVHNGMLGQIRWEQMVFLGNPSFGVRFPPFDLSKVAEGFGLKGFRLDKYEKVGSTLDAFLAHPGPALLEAIVDPHEPPHPPQVKLEQAQKMAMSLARGEHNSVRVGLTLFRDKVKDFLKAGEEGREDQVRQPRR